MPKKKAININFIIPLHVYPFDVMVSINQTDQELAKALNPFAGLSEGDYELCKYTSDMCHGRAAMFSTNASLVRLREIPTTSVGFGRLAHEVFHVVSFVMHRVGMKLKVMVSDEAYAYLTSYLTEEIYKKMNKYY